MRQESDENAGEVDEDAVVWEVIGSIDSLLEKDRRLQEACTPGFFICGAAKAGTTSLFNYLGQHPSIFTPERKEPGYFSALRPLRSPDRYERLFDGARKGQLIGEASGSYLTSPDCAQRIAHVSPQAKIIIMLRNPADRAFSLYRWMTREGYEWISSFEQALEKEGERRGSRSFIENNPEYYYNYLYYTSGRYAHQVERFLDYFDRSQVRFVLFDEFIESPSVHTKNVIRFLGLDDSFSPRTPVRNKGRDTLAASLQYWLCQNAPSYLKLLPGGLRVAETLMRWNKVGKWRTLRDQCRERLLASYEANIRRTGRLISRDLSSFWLN